MNILSERAIHKHMSANRAKKNRFPVNQFQLIRNMLLVFSFFIRETGQQNNKMKTTTIANLKHIDGILSVYVYAGIVCGLDKT